MSQESLLKQLSQLTHLETWNLFQENASEAQELVGTSPWGKRALWSQRPFPRLGLAHRAGRPLATSLLWCRKRAVGWPERRTPLKTGLVCRGREHARETNEMRRNSSIRWDYKNSIENDSLGLRVTNRKPGWEGIYGWPRLSLCFRKAVVLLQQGIMRPKVGF